MPKVSWNAACAAGASYSLTVDQPAMTAHLDLQSAYRRCRSFRKLVRAFGALAAALASPLRCGRPRRGFRDVKRPVWQNLPWPGVAILRFPETRRGPDRTGGCGTVGARAR